MSPASKLRPVPFDLGPVHFIGVGGIGMSGIAEIMLRIGYTVQGSDAKASANTERLARLGAVIHIGHDAAHLDGASAVVFSTAVKPDNPEFAAARERRIPLVPRAEMLAELMRLQFSVAVGGTHGKTTTTSMIASLLDAGGMDPTVVNGGVINSYGSNAKVGKGDWIVVEADESDGSFLKLRSTVAVVTNIDPEHLDHYGDFEAVRAAFRAFVGAIPFYGFAAVCLDHPEVQALVAQVENRRLVTYGTNPQAEVRAQNVSFSAEGARFDVRIEPREGEAATLENLRLPMTGVHNVQNALAAIAVARELGVGDAAIREGLSSFGGVRRRFTTTGVVNGVRIVDDYGHHPVEIAAVLRAARQVAEGRVIAVVQPHRYTRLRDLFAEFSACFNDADTVVVADVYAAGEAPIEGVSRDTLIEGLRRHGHRRALPLEGPASLAGMVAEEARAGDLVVLLGAGDITQWSYALPGQLEALATAPTIRPGRCDEADKLREIERRAGARFRDVGLAFVAEHDPSSAESLRERADDGRLFVAEADGEAIGFAIFSVTDGHGYLEELAVLPERGKRGVGRALIAAVEAEARARNATTLSLSTFRDVPWNAPWYRRLGFSDCTPQSLGPGHVATAERQAATGLDPSTRTFMKRPMT